MTTIVASSPGDIVIQFQAKVGGQIVTKEIPLKRISMESIQLEV